MARTPRVLIAHREAEAYAGLLATACPGLPIVAASEENAPDHMPEADILITIGRWLTADMVDRAPRLAWLQCLISGTDHLQAPLARRPDIALTNARGIHGPQMAETAMMHLLTLSRGGRRLTNQIAARESRRFTPISLADKTVVVVGVGAIAEHFAHVCRPFGIRLIGVSARSDAPEGFSRMVPYAQLHAVAAEAQAVVAFTPLGETTRGLFDASFFAAMNPEGWFINMGRGGLVDEDALIAALEDGALAGAALDVFSQFPLPPESPLWALDTLLISPFIGGQSDRYPLLAVREIIAPNVEAFLAGRIEELRNRVTLSSEAR